MSSSQGSFICSGALLTSTHIVTAGHCLDIDDNGSVDFAPSEVTVFFNHDNPTNNFSGSTSIQASALVNHPNYTGFLSPSVNDDIAVVTLSSSAPSGVPIYPIHTQAFTQSTPIVLAGYGTQGDAINGETGGANLFVKLTGQNLASDFELDDEGGGNREVWLADFDGPAPADLFGDGTTLGNDKEITILGGDSGGPSFVWNDLDNSTTIEQGELEWWGNNTFGSIFAPDFDTDFGGMVGSAYASWLDSVFNSTSTDDHGDNSSSSTPIPIPSTTGGELEVAGDRDFFSFNAIQGIEYEFSTGLNTLSDSTLELYDVDGSTSLVFDDDSGPGLASQIIWTASTSGTYFLEVAGYADNEFGTYDLVAEIDDDHGNDFSEATSLSVPVSTTGIIEIQTDLDYFSFSANAGSTYEIETVLTELSDSTLSLFDTDGTTLITFDDDGGTGLASLITFAPDQSGTYFVAVDNYSDEVGGYGLDISLMSPTNATIIDNGDPGYTTTGNWNTTGTGYLDDRDVHAAGSDTDEATWIFDVPVGSYQVASTWLSHPNRSAAAPYSIYDGSTFITTINASQKDSPDDFSDAGANWENLAAVNISSGQLRVSLGSASDGVVTADAVRIEPFEIPALIVDNGDAGYALTGSWTSAANGYQDDRNAHSASSGSDEASWTFEVPIGTYQVASTWLSHPNRANNAPYSIFDGGELIAFVEANQKIDPDDFNADGGDWEILTNVSVTNGPLKVVLGTSPDGVVTADAIRIAPLLPVDDPDDQINEATLIDEGIFADQIYSANDVDMFAISVQAGERWQFDIDVFNDPSAELDSSVNLFDASGSLIAFSDADVGPDPEFAATESFIDFVFDTSGVYYLAVASEGNYQYDPVDGSGDSGGSTTGFYELIVQMITTASETQIIDNGDAQYSVTGNWTSATTGYLGDRNMHVAGASNDEATWNFTVTPGTYTVSSTWLAHPNRANDAPFSIYDDGVLVAFVNSNQKVAPDDFVDAGGDWEVLANVEISSDTLTVVLGTSPQGKVTADAVHIAPAPSLPTLVVDNGDPGYTSNGWRTTSTGYLGDREVHSASSGADEASWTFDELPVGTYSVSSTWLSHPNRSEAAPYSIYDGNTLITTIYASQKVAPDDFSDLGGDWEVLSNVTITSGTLTVVLGTAPDGVITADAIRIGPASTPVRGKLAANLFEDAMRWPAFPMVDRDLTSEQVSRPDTNLTVLDEYFSVFNKAKDTKLATVEDTSMVPTSPLLGKPEGKDESDNEGELDHEARVLLEWLSENQLNSSMD
ncbi:golvesin C-terminal-like domain-containing protein [Rubripirellula amarantea]|nr:pre-peptidase C-terminal domain-containing protein [Rubripirellula amarantea]